MNWKMGLFVLVVGAALRRDTLQRILSRRKAALTMARCCLAIFALSLSTSSLTASPNIVLIMADDLGYGDLGCYGQRHFSTPHIDALGGRGMRFTQAYAGGPVCTSSRSALMTGLHGGRTPARDNVPHYETYLRKDDVTVAEILKSQGYRNGGVGKWSLGDPGTEGDATNQGFDMWFGYQNQDHAHYYYAEYLDDSLLTSGRLDLTGNGRTKSYYSHDLLTDRAMDFIAESGNGPFFLFAAYTLPHFSHGSEDSDRLAVPDWEGFGRPNWSDAAKKYAAMVKRLDDDVGRIVSFIQRMGLAENTLIIFTSDNGPLGSGPSDELDNNGPLKGAKRSLYEGGIRVPFIASFPGAIPSGTESDEVIAFCDLLPTLAEIAGAKVPDRTDGISLLSVLNGEQLDEKREYLYWDYGHTRPRYDQAVRLGDWKGIRLGQGSPLALFNLKSDIGETKDVAVDHPDIVKRIESIMKSAVVPSDRYPVGDVYQGGPIWKKTW